MRLLTQWVWSGILAGAYDAGYHDLTPAHIGVFRYPGPDGYRPSEIATNLSITKQSVNDLLGDIERRGYLTREPDPDDRRARVVHLTAKGQKLQRLLKRLAQAAEEDIAARLGPQRFAALADALDDLTRELADEEVVTRYHRFVEPRS
jgi:DNA-binding MarR family transcriptional regulator